MRWGPRPNPDHIRDSELTLSRLDRIGDRLETLLDELRETIEEERGRDD